jgi:hypothetical protein
MAQDTHAGTTTQQGNGLAIAAKSGGFMRSQIG